MVRVLIVAQDSRTKSELRTGLARYGVACSLTSYNNGVRDAITDGRPDILLLEMGEQLPDTGIWESIRRAKRGKNLPVETVVRVRTGDRNENAIRTDYRGQYM